MKSTNARMVGEPGYSKGRTAPNKGERYPIEKLTEDEVAALIQRCSRRAPSGIRNAALVAVLFRSGLRIAEALALYPRDVDLDKREINVRSGKGAKQRFPVLTADGPALLARWMDHRKSLGFNGRQPVFCTLKGGPMHATYVRTMLNRIAARAGIEKRLHPHMLRHSHAAWLHAHGVPIKAIACQLGHGDLRTTVRYLESIGASEALDSIRELG